MNSQNTQEAFSIYCECFNTLGEELTKENFEECYHGKYNSIEEFCDELFDCNSSYRNLIKMFKECIDWKKLWDKHLQHEFTFKKGYVFWKSNVKNK